MKVCLFCGAEVNRLENKNPPACKKCYSRFLYEDKREIKRKVKCELNLSSKCEGEYLISLRAEEKNRKRNGGEYICLQCSRSLKYSGRKNPNCKYDIPDLYFTDIETEEKAYILGWIASDGSIQERGFNISIHKRDIQILREIRQLICKQLPIKSYKDQVYLNVNSQQISRDICRHLQISPGKKFDNVKFPNLTSSYLKWAFIRGFFDGDGSICSPHCTNSPRCNISSSSTNMLEEIYNFVNIPGYLGCYQIEWNGNNALDFLGNIYNNSNIRLMRKYERFVDWCLWQPSLSGRGNYGRSKAFRWAKTDKNAHVPSKSRISDAGYDLTIIKKVKTVGDVEFYDTGVKIQPDFGYYFDLVPRSSISKTGYMLANCVGIIDRTYTGPILIALRKVDKSADDLKLPCRIAQIIPRHIVHLHIEEVDELYETERNVGGFGSTGEK